ncbi:MAG: hypothetical protein ACLURV_01210 [Gallintestinimicrobium sp.]
MLAIAAKDIVNAADGAGFCIDFAVKHEALKAYANGETSFTADGQDYTMDADGNILSGGVRSVMSAVSLYRQRKTALSSAVILKKSWQMPSTATPRIYTPMQTVRNTPTPSPTNLIPKPGLCCSRRKPMYMIVMQVLQNPLARHRYKRYGYADPSDVRWSCIPGYRIYRCIY